jgi:arylformamidase
LTDIMPTPAKDAVWRGMSRAELDAAYNNSAHVANSAEKLAEWTERSARVREKHPQLLELRYGERPRNRIDIFPCGAPGAPLFVFIHGGYWQRNSKEIFSCMAQGPMARGFDVALPGYTLAPDA